MTAATLRGGLRLAHPRVAAMRRRKGIRDADCQAESPVKTLDALIVSRVGAEIHVVARARSFLHRQVRSMVGSLAEVGRGRWATGDIARILAAADRTQCGPVAPPEGLYLTRVEYPSV